MTIRKKIGIASLLAVGGGLAGYFLAPAVNLNVEVANQEPGANAPRFSDGAKSRLRPTVKTVERNYSYPELRLYQLGILRDEGAVGLFSQFRNNNALRLGWLSLIAASPSADSKSYFEKSYALTESPVLKHQLVAAAYHTGIPLNDNIISGSGLQGLCRFALSGSFENATELSVEPAYRSILLTELARAGGTGEQIRAITSGPGDQEKAALSEPSLAWIASVDTQSAFRLANNQKSRYKAASEGVMATGFQHWLAQSRLAAETEALKIADLEIPLFRWILYAPDAALAWVQTLDPGVWKELYTCAGFWLTVTGSPQVQLIAANSALAPFLEGVVRGLTMTDPIRAWMLVEQLSPEEQSSLAPHYSVLASELSYIDPELAAKVFESKLSDRLVALDGPARQDFDALRTLHRVYSAIADLGAETAISTAKRLPSEAQSAALAHLSNLFILKGDKSSLSTVLSQLHGEFPGRFRSAVVQACAASAPWDVLEGLSISAAERKTFEETGALLRGQYLPKLVK
jgi:hypothetical protein